MKFVDEQMSWKIATALLVKLEPGDMIAVEAKYHQKCLVNLSNRARALESTVSTKSCDAHLHGIALTELVAFMKDLQKEDIASVFKLTDLAFMCKTQFEQLGVDVEGQIHSSRLKGGNSVYATDGTTVIVLAG